MSNRSSNRPNQRVSKFGEMLKSAADKAEKTRESDVPDALPKPKQQNIFDDHFEWLWQPLPEFTVTANLDRQLLSWTIDFDITGGDGSGILFTVDEAKAVGEALLAASVWQEIWKSHVADYMLGDKVADLKVVEDDDKPTELQ